MNITDLKKSLSRQGILDLDNPKTWCEKIQWLQLHDDIYKRAFCADKLNVHKYSVERLGMDICTPIIKVYNSPEDINFNELPDKFALKCNHGCGYNIICQDKSKLDESECREKLKRWLNENFGSNTLELHYLLIDKKCYAEKFLDSPKDYRIWCFEGTPMYCGVNPNITNNEDSNFYINWYDMDWNFTNISNKAHPHNPSLLDEKPRHFDLIKLYAQKLSKGWHFVRVDFYEVNGTVYLGEMTFTPGTGIVRWTDPEVDKYFGSLINIQS